MASPESRRAKRRAKRREVLPGFPTHKTFETQEELDSYFAGSTIQCLLCGRLYKCVGSHLTKIHGITPDQYRETYKIPWTYGLTCQVTENNYRQATQNWHKETGWEPPLNAPSSKNSRPRVVATKRYYAERLLKYTLTADLKKHEQWEYDLILEVMKLKDLLASEAMELLPNGPQLTSFSTLRKEQEDYDRRYRQTLQDLSFDTLARGQLLSSNTKYQEQVVNLIHTGLTFRQTADRIGSGTAMVAHRAYKKATMGAG